MTTFHQDSIFRYFPPAPSLAQTTSSVAPHSSHLHHVSMSPQPQSQSKLRSNSINSISTDASHQGRRAKSSRPKHSWAYVPVDPAEEQAPPSTATRLEKELHSSFTSNFLSGPRRRTRPAADNKYSYNTASDVTSTAPSSHTEESVYSSKSSNTAVSPASSPAPPAAAASRKRKDSVAASGDPSAHVPKKIKTSSSSSSAAAPAPAESVPAPAVVSPPPPPPKPAEEKPQTRFPGLFPNGLPPLSNKENAAQPKSPGLISPHGSPGSGGNSAQKPAQHFDTSTKAASLTSVDAAHKRKRSTSPSSPSTSAMPKKKKTWAKKAQQHHHNHHHHSPLQQHVTAASSSSSSSSSRMRYPTDQQLSEQLEDIMLTGLRAGPAAYESVEQYRAAVAAEAAWQEGERGVVERMLGNPEVRARLLRLRELNEEIAAERRGEAVGELKTSKKKKKGKNPANKGIGRGNWKRKPKVSEPVVDESDDDGGVGDEEGVDGE
ncbi:uncharacterized protein K452DRAFT_77492 [Aplosporella prunicola CBS 121167]|uniref:Uncharacterized protein n=1 Tax=Aplosporella prunicola CBS 121167 TaxID=1176127 RepID=A0A6A6B604_9PEZI|nr:uncharacterized protein K452DRAFT_77492 [Aplosporella prunicola CBS 121167]KAF2139440.1 hypothetical protein K452DRAFT_77492 [Aplosporella prunicola CBS 121167]